MKVKDLMPWREQDGFDLVEDKPFYGLQQEVNRLFDTFRHDVDLPLLGREKMAFTPHVDITEKNGSFEVTAELPGMEVEDVDLTVTDNMLTIKGEKKQEKEEKKDNYYRMERKYGAFVRSLPLPPETVDKEKVEATFKNGVLTITLPKLPQVQVDQKQIPIKTI